MVDIREIAVFCEAFLKALKTLRDLCKMREAELF